MKFRQLALPYCSSMVKITTAKQSGSSKSRVHTRSADSSQFTSNGSTS